MSRSRLCTRFGALALAMVAGACADSQPEIVAIDYLRATRTGRSDHAVALLDMDEIVDRVASEIALVHTDGDPQRFLRDSIETTIWGLFQETPREEGLAYDAPPADIEGDRARVVVTLTDAAGASRQRTVDLHQTDDGWKVSGESVDHLVTYVLQRLEERF